MTPDAASGETPPQGAPKPGQPPQPAQPQPAQPQPGPYDPILALLRAGKNDAAIVQLCRIVVTRPDDLVAKELLFDAFFQKRDYVPALALADDLFCRHPEVAPCTRPTSPRSPT